ncbi:MAG: hypothetical protein IT200_08970 [Thermoleophilia bacterium]|nr:hypothetical protein [Thermoleophilia bacterium]
MLSQLFVVLETPSYVSDVITGALLLVATLIAAPHLGRWWRSVRVSWRPAGRARPEPDS